MAENDLELQRWLELGDEVARHHRQGHVLAADPALVLRGLPPAWRPVGASDGAAGPADDVMSLAGAALDRLRPESELRVVLVEAAAGCLGSDLPALLRQVRAVVAERPAGAGAAPADDDDDDEKLVRPADPADGGWTDGRWTGGGSARTPGRRLALAGGMAAAALALLGTVAAWPTSDRAGSDHDGPPSSTVPVPDHDGTERELTATPIELVDRPRVEATWDPPHLLVDVGATRYRYRLEGQLDGIVARTGGIGRIELRAVSGGQQWPLAVPALQDLAADADGPGTTGSG